MLISEVSEKYGISPDTLRYYERVGLLPPVRRSKSGLCDYSESDLNWIDFIRYAGIHDAVDPCGAARRRCWFCRRAA